MSRPLLMLLAIFLMACARKPAAAPPGSHDAQLENMLRNVTLTGQATAGGKLLAEDGYVIEKVSKLSGDTWLFHARIGKSKLAVPIPIQVLWAGDTPVITLTDLGIPGIGSYTARVLLYKDQYAGTWSSATHGGHVFGKIIPAPQQN
jgi:hypothetical protein